ncbi:histone-like nucleoid-structuring protein, partial [Xanthomonas perforans]|nr:histone-like nucleoid-structuring protein [Xanthomonas perforans]
MRQDSPASPTAAARAQLLEELRKLEQEEAQLKYA